MILRVTSNLLSQIFISSEIQEKNSVNILSDCRSLLSAGWLCSPSKSQHSLEYLKYSRKIKVFKVADHSSNGFFAKISCIKSRSSLQFFESFAIYLRNLNQKQFIFSFEFCKNLKSIAWNSDDLLSQESVIYLKKSPRKDLLWKTKLKICCSDSFHLEKKKFESSQRRQLNRFFPQNIRHRRSATSFHLKIFLKQWII